MKTVGHHAAMKSEKSTGIHLKENSAKKSPSPRKPNDGTKYAAFRPCGRMSPVAVPAAPAITMTRGQACDSLQPTRDHTINKAPSPANKSPPKRIITDAARTSAKYSRIPPAAMTKTGHAPEIPPNERVV